MMSYTFDTPQDQAAAVILYGSRSEYPVFLTRWLGFEFLWKSLTGRRGR